MPRIITSTIILILALLSSRADAQTLPTDTVEKPWRLSLLTVEPGPEIYELEGHSALRLKKAGDGPDIVVNWGVFDFASPGFVYRFTKGETDYMAASCPTDLFLRQYSMEGRRVTEQRLALSPEEAARAATLIEQNLRPENRVYRYNYIADNCATRPLSIIERALGDTIALSAPDEATATAHTFRQAMRNYHRAYPWYQFGIDLALGSTIDRPISPRAMTFSPVALGKMMESSCRADGRPMVTGTTVIPPATHYEAAPPTPFIYSPLFCSLIVLALTIAITLWDLVKGRLSRGYDVALYTLFGLAGCVIAFLVFISVHEAASPNWLLLWLNPLCLLPLLLIWTYKGRRLLMWWQIINFVAMMGLCVVWIAGAQACNIAFIPLIISDIIRSLFFIFHTRCISPSSHRPPVLYRKWVPSASSVR
ncbi:MAG: DUF4105 domain-containing protein [Pseudoflavonifractor sp.]|nr:DUF4105 domain-containing protein [Alloprevotella sp.]MCM1116280.1 DUF4105 domain-containing protein [Pseudoflavonifractor sp.]